MLIVYSYKFICVYIISFYTNITKIEIRSYHCRFTQSKSDKNVILLYKKLFINSTKFTLILTVFDSNVYSKSNMSRNMSDNIAV